MAGKPIDVSAVAAAAQAGRISTGSGSVNKGRTAIGIPHILHAEEPSALLYEHAAHIHLTTLSSAYGLLEPHMPHSCRPGFTCTVATDRAQLRSHQLVSPWVERGKHGHAHTHTYTHIHTNVHIYTNTHTCTHTRTQT